ncbi:MAG: hypothetical protein EOP47_09480 [Sphingobacteriaceae bacterium]|nr:MAG: hypothetical protein EOP47_09480 [Sphingobacteriaceae bacterium]
MDIPPLQEHYLDKNSDTQRYAFFMFDKKRDRDIFDKNSKPSTLSKEELEDIERLINKEVEAYNSTTKGGKIIQPDKYYKQFIAVTNTKGEKEVWVNCSCSVMTEYWKTNISDVSDGGSCFFNLKINLTLRKVLHFGVNGMA